MKRGMNNIKGIAVPGHGSYSLWLRLWFEKPIACMLSICRYSAEIVCVHLHCMCVLCRQAATGKHGEWVDI